MLEAGAVQAPAAPEKPYSSCGSALLPPDFPAPRQPRMATLHSATGLCGGRSVLTRGLPNIEAILGPARERSNDGGPHFYPHPRKRESSVPPAAGMLGARSSRRCRGAFAMNEAGGGERCSRRSGRSQTPCKASCRTGPGWTRVPGHPTAVPLPALPPQQICRETTAGIGSAMIPCALLGPPNGHGPPKSSRAAQLRTARSVHLPPAQRAPIYPCAFPAPSMRFSMDNVWCRQGWWGENKEASTKPPFLHPKRKERESRARAVLTAADRPEPSARWDPNPGRRWELEAALSWRSQRLGWGTQMGLDAAPAVRAQPQSGVRAVSAAGSVWRIFLDPPKIVCEHESAGKQFQGGTGSTPRGRKDSHLGTDFGGMATRPCPTPPFGCRWRVIQSNPKEILLFSLSHYRSGKALLPSTGRSKASPFCTGTFWGAQHCHHWCPTAALTLRQHRPHRAQTVLLTVYQGWILPPLLLLGAAPGRTHKGGLSCPGPCKAPFPRLS